MNLRSTCPLFGGAVWAAAVLLIGSHAQAQNLFVSCGNGSLEYPLTTGSVIFEFTPGGAQISFASGFFALGLNGPEGLAFNSAGDLFETDQVSGHIYEFTPGGLKTTFASGLSSPCGLAFNTAGDLFEADLGSNHIYELTPDGTQSTFASGLTSSPFGLAFQPVPEPSAFGSLAVGATALLVSRRRSFRSFRFSTFKF